MKVRLMQHVYCKRVFVKATCYDGMIQGFQNGRSVDQGNIIEQTALALQQSLLPISSALLPNSLKVL